MAMIESPNAKSLVLETLDMYDAQEFHRLDEFLAEDFEVRVLGASFRGHDEVRGMLTMFYSAFPDLVHHVDEILEVDGTVAMQIRVTATHEGPFVSVAGTIPATGRPIEWRSGNFVRVEDGKLKGWNIYLDQLGIMMALGYEPKEI